MEQHNNRLTIQVGHSCGCGFNTTDPQLARNHAREFEHTVTVNGTIRPPHKRPKRIKVVELTFEEMKD